MIGADESVVADEARKLPPEELEALLRAKRNKLYALRASAVVGQDCKTHMFPALRRDIARLNTIKSANRIKGERNG